MAAAKTKKKRHFVLPLTRTAFYHSCSQERAVGVYLPVDLANAFEVNTTLDV
jgi:hypothetical protein